MRKEQSMKSRRNPRRRYLAILLGLYAGGCSGTKHVNSLDRFAQNGQRTLFEVTDRGGRSWKVGSVEQPGITTYFVVRGDGRVAAIATAFDDRLRAKHAVVFVDSTEKEEALAVLDQKFLAGVANASEAYRKWVEKHAVFTYGSVQDTRRIDFPKGGLGSGDIRVDGNTIAGRLKDYKCHCYDMPQLCAALPSPWVACLNKICDVVNCGIAVINGGRSDCNQETSDAKTTCELAVGLSPE
jgi:hypothetical protein